MAKERNCAANQKKKPLFQKGAKKWEQRRPGEVQTTQKQSCFKIEICKKNFSPISTPITLRNSGNSSVKSRNDTFSTLELGDTYCGHIRSRKPACCLIWCTTRISHWTIIVHFYVNDNYTSSCLSVQWYLIIIRR